jgi:predicted phosphohydrolase
VDDNTDKILENIGAQYEYSDSDLLEQMIEAELIIMFERVTDTRIFSRDISRLKQFADSELPEMTEKVRTHPFVSV